MRVKRSILDEKVRRINKLLERPTTGYRAQEGIGLMPNAGHLCIDAYSPGDGITRYRLAEMTVGGGQRTLRETACLGASAFDDYLAGILCAFDLAATEEMRDSLRGLLAVRDRDDVRDQFADEIARAERSLLEMKGGRP